MVRLLIDGDILIYQTSVSLQVSTPINEIIELEELKNGFHNNFLTKEDVSDIIVSWANIDDVMMEVHRRVDALKRRFKTDNIIITLSDLKNFRKDVLATYKMNRKNVIKPVCLPFVRKHIQQYYPHVIYPRLEADDVMGILATDPDNSEEQIIVSDDKDLEQIPGRLYKPMTKKLLTITEKQGQYKWYEQTLTGDAVDNYIGCPKIGPKKAKQILDINLTGEDVWSNILSTYQGAGLTKEDMLVQANVARMLKHGDYNIDTNKIKLFKY